MNEHHDERSLRETLEALAESSPDDAFSRAVSLPRGRRRGRSHRSALREDPYRVRASAARALGEHGALGAAARLHATAENDSSETVRVMATCGLALLDDDANATRLLSLAERRKGSPMARALATEGLAHLAGTAVSARLARLATDGAREVRKSARYALGERRDRMARAALRKLRASR